MLFLEPIWLSILIPTFFALVLLIASLAVRHWQRGSFDKSAVLSAAGLALAAVIGGAPFALLVAALALVTHAAGLAIERAGGRAQAVRGSARARAWLASAVVVQIAIVAASWRAGAGHTPLEDVRARLVPFGVSYFAFHAVAYVIDVYRRRVAAERSRPQLALHLVLLPQLVGGPIPYEAIARQLARHLPSISDYSYGVRRLLIGVWKVFAIAYVAGRQADAVFAQRPAALTTFQAWVGLTGFALQIYYAFSGYSDMGIGLARMAGIRLPENFRWPYVGDTIREFWRRWHIGLTAWFREYADLSIDPERIPPPSAAREALVILLCGVWYGVGSTFAIWGLYHASLVALEWAGLEAAVKRMPAPLRHAYVVVAVTAGWVVLRSATPADAAAYFQALAGLNTPPVRYRPGPGFDLWLILAAGIVGCAPLSSTIRRWTVAIDALIVSLLMMLFAAVLFAWRCVRIVATPVLRGGR